jgi:hypothetical protein
MQLFGMLASELQEHSNRLGASYGFGDTEGMPMIFQSRESFELEGVKRADHVPDARLSLLSSFELLELMGSQSCPNDNRSSAIVSKRISGEVESAALSMSEGTAEHEQKDSSSQAQSIDPGR